MPKWIKWVFLGIAAVILILVLTIGLWIRLRTVSAVKEIVIVLSHGKYGIKAKTIRVDPFNMSAYGRDIYIYPLQKGSTNNEFELKADSISLSLSHIFQLLLRNNLNVDSFTIIRPQLVMTVYEKVDRQKKIPVPLHMQVARIQTVFFNVLQSMKVNKFKLSDGSIAYYPDFNDTHSRYFLNNINLGIDNLHLLENFSSGNRYNKAAIHLELMAPQIEIPDSSIRINLDHFDWNTRYRHFDITGLGFHKSIISKGDSSGFQLQGIELDSMNWNKLLSQGIVELGELKAKKGYFSSNNFSLKKKAKDSLKVENNSNLLDIIGPILIKHLAIYEIEFVGNTHTNRGKETFRINGDLFDVKQLVIDKSLPNKVELQELNLKVKAFMETDSSRTFQAGFGEVVIKGNNLTLKDYYLHSLSKSRFGENKIDVKKLEVEGLSIPELIGGKLKARQLLLVDPFVRLILPAGKKKNGNTNWQKLQANIRKKLDIGVIGIINANVLVNQENRSIPLFKTDSFYAIISSRKVMKSRTLEDLFAGLNSFNMPKLAIRLPAINIDFRNANYDKNSFFASSAEGKTKNGNISFKFNQLSAKDINAAGIIHQQDTGLLRVLDIGNGEVFINIPENKSAGTKKIPSQIVRTIHTGPIKFHVSAKTWSLESAIDSIYIEKLKKVDSGWVWLDYLVRGNKLEINHPALKGNSGKFVFAANLGAVINNSHWEIDNPKLKASADIPSVQITNTITSTKNPIEEIQKVSLKDPVITALLKQFPEKNTQTGKAKSTELPAISLENPQIKIRKEKADSIIEIASVDGGQIAIDRVQLEEETYSTKSIKLDLKNISSRQEKYDVQVPYLKLNTGSINFRKGEPFQTNIHALDLQEGRFDFHDSSKLFSLNGINIKLDKSFRLNTSKDSLNRLLTTLPHLNLHTNKLFYEKGGRQIIVDELKVASDKKQISFDSLQWVGTISRDSFFKAARIQKDFIQLHIGSSLLNGYEMLERGKDTVWTINQFNLSNLNMLLERDKRFPPDSINYKPLMTGLLQNLPLQFSMEKIILEHANIRYNEISEKKGKEGSIWFSDINATIRNIRNIDIKPTDSLYLSARAKLMDKGNIRLSFRESYADSLQGFFMFTRMGKMELNALSPLLYPLFNVKIDRGNVDSLWLRVKANDYLAYGKMEMDYRNLKLSLMDDEGKKKGFTSSLINIFLKSKNDKTGLVFKERLRNKSMFNYWGKIAISGLLTNMGVQKNRKYAKKYKKEMKQLQLPEDLLAE